MPALRPHELQTRRLPKKGCKGVEESAPPSKEKGTWGSARVAAAAAEGALRLIPTVMGTSLLLDQQPPPAQPGADFPPFQPKHLIPKLRELPQRVPSLPAAQFLLVAPRLESAGKYCEQGSGVSLPPKASRPLSAARKRQINRQR